MWCSQCHLLFAIYLMPHLMLFCGCVCVCVWFCCSKSSLSIMLTYCLVFPKHKKIVMCLMKNVCVLDKLCSGMSYGVVSFKFNVNDQQRLWNRVSLSRSMFKTRLYIHHMTNVSWSDVVVVHVISDSLCPMGCSMPGFPVLHHLPEFAQT